LNGISLINYVVFAVMWIRIGFNAAPDPAFYLNADPDLDQGRKTNTIHSDTDTDPGQILPLLKDEPDLT
jgi:hypothetical protein